MSEKGSIFPPKTITVVICDTAPVVHWGGSPTYRSVRIELTPNQMALLRLRYSHTSGEDVFHEHIDSCFFDEQKP